MERMQHLCDGDFRTRRAQQDHAPDTAILINAYDVYSRVTLIIVY